MGLMAGITSNIVLIVTGIKPLHQRTGVMTINTYLRGFFGTNPLKTQYQLWILRVIHMLTAFTVAGFTAFTVGMPLIKQFLVYAACHIFVLFRMAFGFYAARRTCINSLGDGRDLGSG